MLWLRQWEPQFWTICLFSFLHHFKLGHFIWGTKSWENGYNILSLSISIIYYWLCKPTSLLQTEIPMVYYYYHHHYYCCCYWVGLVMYFHGTFNSYLLSFLALLNFDVLSWQKNSVPWAGFNLQICFVWVTEFWHIWTS